MILRKGQVPQIKKASAYPAPFDENMDKKPTARLGDAGGLTQFGVNLVTLEPGGWASHRHWHENEDEFVYILSGEATLIDDDGAHVLHPGDAATFPAGIANAHHLVNRSDADMTFLVAGTKAAVERAHYADVDMEYNCRDGERRFTHRDGSPIGGAR